MELFSQEYGHKPLKTLIQLDGMDKDLRNGLWNALDKHYWWKVERQSRQLEYFGDLYNYSLKLWEDYFKKPLDTMPTSTQGFKQEVRDYFFSCEWFEVYDFIKFIANNHANSRINKEFIKYCNEILKREVSGYRFVGATITRITKEEEIAEIEEVLRSVDSLVPVIIHIKSAIELFSDRTSPDYRNSIKESISAVEAMSILITGKKKATLGQALNKINTKVDSHPALNEAFNSLYGYTSDAEGIRHALLEAPGLDFEDAKFMLVSCSAFINYLKTKASKAGIAL